LPTPPIFVRHMSSGISSVRVGPGQSGSKSTGGSFMNALLKIFGALMLAAGLSVAPAAAQTKLTVPGGSTTGTYMDYMKTVYARASGSELLQVPLTSFDNEYQLTALAAESWTQSDDGLSWTFKLRD